MTNPTTVERPVTSPTAGGVSLAPVPNPAPGRGPGSATKPTPAPAATVVPSPSGGTDGTGSSTPPTWVEIARAISASLTPRGIATTEFWVSLVGMGLTVLLAHTGVSGSTATQIVSTAAPAVIAGVYAYVRAQHKSALAEILDDIFPQYDNASS